MRVARLPAHACDPSSITTDIHRKELAGFNCRADAGNGDERQALSFEILRHGINPRSSQRAAQPGMVKNTTYASGEAYGA